MVLAWPLDLRPSAASFYIEHNALRMESPLSKAQQTLIRPGARWVCRLDFNRRGTTLAPALDALIAEMDGGAQIVELFDWRRPVPRGTAATGATSSEFTDTTTFTDGTGFTEYASTPELASAADRGAEVLYSTGWDASADVLLAGDYIGLNGRVYQVVRDVTSDGSGDATLRIRPRLRAAVGAGARITFVRPTSPFRLAVNAVENPTEPGPFSTYSLTFVEALP